MTASNPPNVNDAAHIAWSVLGKLIANTKRMCTGGDNWVFAVGTCDGARAVVRIMREHATCAAAVRWNDMLCAQGVPLPRLLASHVGSGDDRSWMLLERLPGRDLEYVYGSLMERQKLAILRHVLRAQCIVHQLPRPAGFGYIVSPDDPPPHARWIDVLRADLDRSRTRIEAAGLGSPGHVDRVARLIEHDSYNDVEPVPFLDDSTTRNVMVADGRFMGIVDVDGICVGDPMLTAALTRMALLHHARDTTYADTWFEQLDPGRHRRRRFDAYTAMFCVNFMGEAGQQFNRDTPPPVDPVEVRRLEAILDSLLLNYE